jgi:glucose-6-phosphate-specific signal transduction histidine kinase
MNIALTPIEKGFNKTNENRVRYSALPPGDYWFEVQAVNNSGLRTPTPERLHFVIHPPFWQQWWFITILVILIAGVIVFIYNYFRINRLVDIERMRVRIASDLHDDVGATLTEIALNTDFLMATNASKDIEQPLFEIGDLARNVVSSLDDIVWSIDARNDTAGDLGDRIQDTASHVFRNQKTKLHYEFDSSNTAKALPVEVRENVFLIVKEALNNAAKYAKAANIWVKIAFTKGFLEVQIKDDGIGINNHSNERKGNGLLNMKMRAQRIAAKLHIEGNKGTTIRLSNIRV